MPCIYIYICEFALDHQLISQQIGALHAAYVKPTVMFIINLAIRELSAEMGVVSAETRLLSGQNE